MTREGIIRAALAGIDAEGVDQLSMRRLGQRLGVDPMAIYHHLPNKAALFDGIVEHIWTGVHVPAPAPGQTWQRILYEVFAALRARLLQHPRAVVIVGSRPTITPAMLQVVDAALGRLEAAGLPGTEAMQLIDCLSGYTIGKVLAEIGEPLGGVTTSVESAIAGISPETHPHLLGVTAAGYHFAPDEEFDRGLRAMIKGWGGAAR